MHLEIGHLDYSLQYFKERYYWRCAYVERIFGEEVTAFINDYADMGDADTIMLSTSGAFNIEMLNDCVVRSIVNLRLINNIAQPNEFFSLVNKKVSPEGYFICCAETLKERRQRIFKRYPPFVAYPYSGYDFVVRRVLPKLSPTRSLYLKMTGGTNRVISMTEILGRLVACGFQIVTYRDIDNITFFVCRKLCPPYYNGLENSGFLIKLLRVGQDGKFINVYKFRTMHPYAEYLQDYIYNKNNFSGNCKIKKDYRVTSWGRFLRKFWIDEQPMWINWLKKEVKLVGVRPLSEQFYNLYPPDLQKRRIKHKPGLIPPFYVDMPQTLEEVVASEHRYLDAYEKHPRLTDFKYFWIALYNIIVKKVRST